MPKTIALCAICQKETTHIVTYEDSIDPKTNEVLFPKFAIKLTCENTTDQLEHAIRMSPSVTKDEVMKILDNQKQIIQQQVETKAVNIDDETYLTNLFN